MVKCPNCGSTAQPRIDDHETYIWKDIVAVYLIYKCGCGCRFSTRLEANRSEEKFYGEMEKEA